MLVCWESFREFVEAETDDCGMFIQWPEEAGTYFDWEKYERDCRYDYTVANAPNTGVFVFRSC
ncbi:MAG: antirestriction protein ArdA [Actinomyces succiniciruminis]|nr:antirestriction protein ArdA [Actinomyces succiniciruminis]